MAGQMEQLLKSSKHFVSFCCFVTFFIYIVFFTYNPSKNDEALYWIGKAYVLSTKNCLPDDLVASAKACGFLPQKVSPILAFGEHYEFNKTKMYESCFKVPGRPLLPFNKSAWAPRTTLAEISLVYSHRYLLELIAQDSSMLDSDWALIMEDDAVLNPEVDPRKARLYSLEAIKSARLASPVEGFIYFGICGSTCKQNFSTLANDSLFISQYCHGYCTHAYAVTKFTARNIFPVMYNNELLNSSMIQIDQGYNAYFKNNVQNNSLINAYVVGSNFHSPDIYLHIGLLYQCNRTVKSRGTTLISDEFRPQTCFIVRSDAATVPQLLQHYATLVSICLMRKVDPHVCASFTSGKKNNLVFQNFVLESRLRPVTCVYNNVTVRFIPSANKIRSGRENRTRNVIANMSYGSAISLASFDKMPLVPGAVTIMKELLTFTSPYGHGKKKDAGKVAFPFTIWRWLSGSPLLPTRCVPYAVEVCMHVSVNKGNMMHLMQKFYSAAVQQLSVKYPKGVAIKLIADKKVKESQLDDLLSWPLPDNTCLHSTMKYDGHGESETHFDHDLWTILQLRDCSHIVLASGSAAWWGAYFSTADVIISGHVKRALPSWTVL